MGDYIREGRGTTLISSGELREEASGYQMEMIRKNHLTGLLPIQICAINDQREYHYDAGALLSLYDYLDKRTISAAMLEAFTGSIRGVLSVIEEYLLDKDCLCMQPEHIYVEEKENELYFCYGPYVKNGFDGGLQKLLQFFLGKLDYSDRQGVMTAYEMYQNAVKEGHRAALSLEYKTEEYPEEAEEKEEIVFPWEDNDIGEKEGDTLQEKERKHTLYLPMQLGIYTGGIVLCGVAAAVCYWQNNLLLCGGVLLVTAAVLYLLIKYGRQYKGIDSSQNTW